MSDSDQHYPDHTGNHRPSLKILILIPLMVALACAALGYAWYLQHQPTSVDAPANPVVLRLAHAEPATSNLHTSALMLASEVDKQSNGLLQIKVQSAKPGVTDHALLQQLHQGQVDIIIPPSTTLTTLEPSLQMLDLPFLFKSREHAHHALDDQPGQMLLSRINQPRIAVQPFLGSRLSLHC